MPKRRFVLWLFPIALLLAQVGGLAHGVAHTVPGGPSKERLAGTIACDQCVSFAKLAHVATDAPEAPLTGAPATAATTQSTYHRSVSITLPYQSRGPPILC